LVHVLDVSSRNILSDFDTTIKELKDYKSDLVEKINCVVLNKVDRIKSKNLEKIVKTFNNKGIEVLPISTFSRVGIDKLKDNLLELLKKNKLKKAKPDERTEKWSPI
jgi:GTPase involved in cell partitioning and DNA repair